MSDQATHQHVLDFIADELPPEQLGGMRLHGKRTEISLELDGNTTEAEWEAWGERLQRAGEGLDWHIGDWLLFGEKHFPGRDKKGPRYQQLAKIVGVKVQQLQNIVSVVRVFPPSRRRTELSFTHHEKVAPRVLSDADRERLLDDAIRYGWSVTKLVKERQKIGKPGGLPVGPRMQTPFRGLVREPINEQGVVFLFGMIAHELGYEIEIIQTGFPDCTAVKKSASGSESLVSIEFEFIDSNFKLHGHPQDRCDEIVCWKRDEHWKDKPANISVLELQKAIQKLPHTF